MERERELKQVCVCVREKEVNQKHSIHMGER